MSTTSAKIAAANLKDTGVTPDMARKMWDKLGSRHIAVVELVVDERTEDVGDTRGVKLTVTSIEVAGDNDMAEHMRELQRAIYMSRQSDKALTAGVEDTPKDIATRGQVTVLHCDRCVHSLGHAHINHGKRPGVACIWTKCRHTVNVGQDVCSCSANARGELAEGAL